MAKSDNYCPDFICDKCGGYMLYNFDLGSAECTKCHRTFGMEYYSGEDAWRVDFNDVWDGDFDDSGTLTCPACGSSLGENEVGVMRCPSCGAKVYVECFYPSGWETSLYPIEDDPDEDETDTF